MKNLPSFLWITAAAIFLFASPSFADHYKIDLDHTDVSFKIHHLLSNVQGHFTTFEGNFTYDPAKPETWKAEATLEAASIDTNVKERDKHLRSADFFDVEKYPTISFKSTEVTDAAPENAKLHGLLTIHGIEKPVVLDLEIHGVAKDPWGNVRASFTATTEIKRSDFALTWNKVVEAGKFLVGDDVKITLEVEGIKQEEDAAVSSGGAETAMKEN